MTVDFLGTDRPKAELAVALAVIREFKAHESQDEWLAIPFIAWAKLEELEGYLDRLIEARAALSPDATGGDA